MKKKPKRIWMLLVPLILVGLFALYLFFNPVYFVLGRLFHPRRLSDLATARNYYSILSSFAGFIVGVLGLLVGYLYYKLKQSFDQETSNRERKRKRLDDLLDNLNIFDDLVDELICFRFRDEAELKTLRHNIRRSFDKIEAMINLNHVLLGLDDHDIAAITNVYSFIDKNEMLMYRGYSEISTSEFENYLDEYSILVKSARLKCLAKVA